jgi:hypothetical protein
LEDLEWDYEIGPKPVGFDDLPLEEKAAVVKPYIDEAHFVLGREYMHYIRRIVDFHDTEEEWLRWRKLAYKRHKQRLYEEYMQVMASYSRPATHQNGNAINHSRQGKNRKHGRDRKLDLVPPFIRKLFLK